MDIYSKKVMEHFRNPRNFGVMKNPDVVVRVGNPVCGDVMEMQIKVKCQMSNVKCEDSKKSVGAKVRPLQRQRSDLYISDIKFRTLGCGAAIATSSVITTMVKGKTLEEALKVSNKDVARELGGLPAVKMHCSNLAAEAVHKGIKKYLRNEKDLL